MKPEDPRDAAARHDSELAMLRELHGRILGSYVAAGVDPGVPVPGRVMREVRALRNDAADRADGRPAASLNSRIAARCALHIRWRGPRSG